MSRVSLAASAIVASRRASGCVHDVTVRYNILLCFELNLQFFGPASRTALGSMPLFEFFGI
jgi:hypothetical protein